MKLKILYEGMESLITATFDLLKKRLEDEGHYMFGDVIEPGVSAFLRVVNPFNPTAAVTIHMDSKQWPEISIDAGVPGTGIVEKAKIDLSAENALDEIAAFASKYVQYKPGIEGPKNIHLYRMAARFKHLKDSGAFKK